MSNLDIERQNEKPPGDGQPKVTVIYDGGYTDTLGIVAEGDLKGWLVYRHVDGQWVTLADLKVHLPLMSKE